MPHRLSVWLVAVCSLFVSMPYQSSDAQERLHTGRSAWRTFDSRDTGAASVTHQAHIDARGYLYAANDAGLLNYDGARWQLFKTGLSSRPLKALLPLDGNRWLAGGAGLFGMFTPDQLGTLQWTDISLGLEGSANGFSDTVLNLIQTSAGVLILTDQRAFRLLGGDTSTLEIGVPTGFAFNHGERIIVGIESVLIEITPEGHKDLVTPLGWSDINPVQVIYTANGEPVLVTRRSGMFKVALDDDAVRLTPLWDTLPPPLDTVSITTATIGPAGSFYLGSENGTFIQLNDAGIPVLSLDRRASFRTGAITSIVTLPDESKMVFFDGGASWLSPSNGFRLYKGTSKNSVFAGV